MKILFVTASAEAGGGPRHLLDWIQAVKDLYPKELEVYLAAPRQGLFAKPLRDLSVDSIELPERKLSFQSLLALWQFTRKHQIKLVHSFGRAGGVYGRWLGLQGCRVFHTPQGLISAGLSQFMYDRLERILKPLTTEYVFGSVAEATEGARRFSAPRGLILPPIVLPPEVDRVDRCAEAVLQKRPITIGTIGRFVDHKRMLELAHAVLAMGPQYRLFLYGDGVLVPQLKELERQSHGRIQVRGLMDRWKALDEIDIFASWSRSESFGLAVAEAMAVGVPCVLSDVIGHRDLASDDRAWLFNPECQQDFAQAVHEVIENTDLRKRRTANAYAHIRALCSQQRVAHELWRSYQLKH